MNQFSHNGLKLEYEISGEGKPLFFLHGMGGSIKQIYSIYEPINGVRLICMNQQGHGESEVDWEHYDFEHLGSDVIALMDELQIERAYFAGISMGAAVCLNVAIRYPNRVEKLLLIRNAWTDKPMTKEVQIAYADLGSCLKKGGLEAFYKTQGWNIVAGPSAYTRNAFVTPFQDISCMKYWEKYLILPKQVPIGSVKDLSYLNMPVIILACNNDLCHPFEYGEYLSRYIDGAEIIEIVDKDTDKILHKRMLNQEIYRLVLC